MENTQDKVNKRMDYCMIARYHTGDENGWSNAKFAKFALSQDAISDGYTDVWLESVDNPTIIQESNKSGNKHSIMNTENDPAEVIVRRIHEGDENGYTTYYVAIVKASKILDNGEIEIHNCIAKESTDDLTPGLPVVMNAHMTHNDKESKAGWVLPWYSNEVIVRRDHYGDENGHTDTSFSTIWINEGGKPAYELKVIDKIELDPQKESSSDFYLDRPSSGPTTSFVFFADPHIHNNHDHAHNSLNINIAKHIKENPDDIKYVIIGGDLMGEAKTDEDRRYMDIWRNSHLNSYVVCDGYGNHDMASHYGEKADYKKYILDVQAKSRRKNLNGFVESSNQFHYRWIHTLTSDAININVHFIMLNLSPSNGDDNRIHNNNGGMDFLKDSLNKIGKKEPIFLFHHYGFRQPSNEGLSDGEEWWPEIEQTEYLDTIKEHNIKGICYGHSHSYVSENMSVYTNDGSVKYISTHCVGTGTLSREILKINLSIKNNELSVDARLF